MSKKTNPQKFYDDLRKFQAKYPMCYIEAWTPEDYVSAANQGNEDEDSTPVDWNDPDHEAVADRLSRHFDANIGTNWDRVRLELE